MGGIDYANSVKAGTTVFASSLSISLSSKAVFIYIVLSPRFIPSPCFILSPESTFYTQSAVCGPQCAVPVLY